ncbi:MAG TPA: alpha/beta hydrolase [Usitatibacter sp.]|nr:alpha/beta hydrolase [Usitatibacter sp.]
MTASNVFILPGLLEDADAFAAVMRGLADVATCQVADMTRADSIAGLARSALEQAPAGPLHLAGHSMGGYVALEIMRQAPGRVAKLALLNTHARPDSPESTENRRRLLKLAETDFQAVISTLLPKLMTAEHVRDAALAGIVGGMALAVGKEAFARQQAAIIGRIDSRPHLAAIRCPTLVVAARSDQLMPVEILQEMADAIPGARLEIVEDCGHMAPMEQPREVIALLREWLTGRREPGPTFPVEAPPAS